MKATAQTVADERSGRWRWLRTPVSAAGLLLIERQLVAVMGTPTAQVRALLNLGLSPSDPITPVLAVLAVLAEALIGYVLVMLVLRTLSLVPGSLGRLAGRVTFLVSPDVVRRALDLLVGGTLLAQATLTAMPSVPPGPVTDAIHTTVTPLLASVRPTGPTGPTRPATEPGPHLADAAPGHLQTSPLAEAAARRLQASPDAPPGAGPPMIRSRPAETRPPSRRVAAPLPPWLGGGPSKPRPGDTVEASDTVQAGDTVEPGDTLWDIAASHLARPQRSPANVHRYWQQVYRANRRAIGADPDLILPGTHLDVPRFRGERR
jgi:hypothetical protein